MQIENPDRILYEIRKSVSKNCLESDDNDDNNKHWKLKDLQGQAADLNLLQEKITTSGDPSRMEYDIQLLMVDNEREAYEAEQIFYDVKSLKEKVASLEKDYQLVMGHFTSFRFEKKDNDKFDHFISFF